MKSALRQVRFLYWLILLVAGLGPVHGFLDEALDACPIALSEARDHGHDHGDAHDRGVSESEPCHEHCAIGRTTGPARTFSVAKVAVADLSAAFLEPPREGDSPAIAPCRTWPTVRRTSPSAFHQRVGLRLYA